MAAEKLFGGLEDNIHIVDDLGDVIRDQGGNDTVETTLNVYTLPWPIATSELAPGETSTPTWITYDNQFENLKFIGTGDFTATGSYLNNVITGADGNDVLIGGSGVDTLVGGEGNDLLVGGERNIYFDELGRPMPVAYSDTAIGDRLEGGKGNDTYVIGRGDIVVEKAGEGTDTVDFRVNPVFNPDYPEPDFTYTLGNNVENLRYNGGFQNFYAIGNESDNVIKMESFYYNSATLDGGAGADTLIGGAGADTYIVGDGDVVIDSGTDFWRADTVKTTLNQYTLSDNIEILIFEGEGPFYGVGGNGENLIVGGNGNDTLVSGGSNEWETDILRGGNGNDTYRVHRAAGVDEKEGGGIDTVIIDGSPMDGYDSVVGDLNGSGSGSGGAFNYDYDLAHVENLFYDGTSNFDAFGNAADNEIRGNVGNDTLGGGAGTDTLIGGAGNDTYVISTEFESPTTDRLVEMADGGTDTVMISDPYSVGVAFILADNLENLNYMGGGNLVVTGNASNNEFTAGFGNNTISGGDGDDTLILVGERSDYTVTKNADGSVSLNGWQNSLVSNIEVFKFYDAVVSLANLLKGYVDPTLPAPPQPPVTPPTPTLEETYSGNNSLSGTSGVDYLKGYGGNDVLKAGAGNDYLYGGHGNDKLYGQSGKDSFVFDTTPNKSTNKDAIMDFSVKDDTIRPDNAIFTKLGSKTGTLKSAAFWSNNTGKAHDKDDRIIYDKDSGVLYYDADGSGKGAGVAFATIGKKLAITNKDFVVF